VDELVFKRRRGRLSLRVIWAAYVVLGALLMVWGRPEPASGLPWAFILDAAIALGVIGMVVWREWARIVVTTEGIRARTVRTRFIPWVEVRDIKVTRFGGDREVDIHLLDGSRRTLPAPVDLFNARSDGTFNKKYAALIAAWNAYGRPSPRSGEDGHQPAGDPAPAPVREL